MKKQELYDAVLSYFEKIRPNAATELHFNNTFELLVAVMLSAQCTDKRVNMVMPALMKAYPSPELMASASPDDLLHFMGSVSYPNSKAQHLIGMSQMLINNYQSTVPESFDDLIKLPGVGRKTANVIQSVAFHKPTLAVDTHVFRVSHRLGLVPTSCTTPLSVELELLKHIPKDKTGLAHHWLLLHGRYVCTSRNPKCSTCELNNICKYVKGKSIN
jgi:endonuclease-3